MNLRIFHSLLALLLFPAVVFGQYEIPEHLIPPGYEPEQVRDEQGLWHEFEEFERQLSRSPMLVRDTEINEYILGIVCRVAAAYCNDFRVYVVRNPFFNASMDARGTMQIWTGLIVRAKSTDEIAAVVGHEIAHYTRLHSLQRLRDIRSKMSAGSFLDFALAVTGVSGGVPIAQMMAMMSILSFSREQETEADLLGTQLMADAQYDPHAAYIVWQRILEEEEAARVKREEPGIFSQTHPASEDRAAYLENLVSTRYGEPDEEWVADEDLLRILNNHYAFLMEDQLDTNRFGRTEELLRRHTDIGVNPGLVQFFYGEMYRQRSDPGDDELAMEAYLTSVDTGSAPPEAYKNLGYLHLKAGNTEAAQAEFRTYLELKPDATDRAMIEFYLEE